jgi:hypothetical protein
VEKETQDWGDSAELPGTGQSLLKANRLRALKALPVYTATVVSKVLLAREILAPAFAAMGENLHPTLRSHSKKRPSIECCATATAPAASGVACYSQVLCACVAGPGSAS